ncbi:hypothetical protein [Aurantivibrio plasticivorans]
MPVTYTHEKNSKFVFTRVDDVLTTGEIISHFSRMIDDAALPPEFVEVVDFGGCRDVEFRYSDFAKLQTLSLVLRDRGLQISLFRAFSQESRNIIEFLIPLFTSISITTHICSSESELADAMDAFLNASVE